MKRFFLITTIPLSFFLLSCQKDKNIKDRNIAVSAVSLDLSSASLVMGNSIILTAEVWPPDATNKTLSWSSSNTDKATVISTGSNTAKVTMPSNATAGFVDITVSTEDGLYEATCKVMVSTLSSDGAWSAYQTHTTGPGIDLVFFGDAYSASDITGGKYEEDMFTAIEGFFDIQPFKAYRNYFNAYIVVAESGESQLEIGVQKDTKFSTHIYDGSTQDYSTYFDLCLTYAQKAPIGDINNTVVVLIVNTQQYFGAWMLFDSTGKAVAVCPTTPHFFKAFVQHEAGGHGFGKLGDEYYSEGVVATQSALDALKSDHSIGYNTNVDITNDLTKILWKDFIGHPQYSMVGAFEGALYCETGMWRSEAISRMSVSTQISYFNAPSRAAIVKRIKTLAGEPFTMEWFMSVDIIEPPLSTKATMNHLSIPHTPPVWIQN